LRLLWPAPFEAARETAFDALIAAWPRPDTPAPVLVVEIDRASLAALGPWPWPRARIATLVEALHAAGAAVVATDILFEGPDRASPARLARQLAEAMAAQPEEAEALRARATTLPDHDAALATALATGPSVLGFLLAPEASAAPPLKGALAQRERPPAAAPMAAPGAILPLAALLPAAAGLGAVSLTGNPVREVPLLVEVAGEWRASLVLETLRMALAVTPIIEGVPPGIRLGSAWLPVDSAMAVRLHPASPARRTARSVSASALLAGAVPPAWIEGQLVLLGGAAPELGALRGTAFGPLQPAVQLQAEALEQALTLWLPIRPALAGAAEFGLAATLGLGGAIAGAALAPLGAAGLALTALVLLPFGALLLLHGALLLADPVLPLLTLAAGLGSATLAHFVATRASRARLVARFAQSLPPALVARIAREPGLLRIGGETRRMSFVFTDIAGFTGLVERSGAARLIALLDAYIGGAAEIVAEHGGTLDKVVGDALHVMFGAPLEQPDHAARALACGIALAEYGEAFAAARRAEGFGITRVGIATGLVVVGDVGGGRALDYTAHGDAVNLAARLEQANKLFGTRVLLDEATAQACPEAALRPIARLAARGRGAVVMTFAPWRAPEAARTAWGEALAALDSGDRIAAEAALHRLLALLPEDGPARFHLARLARGEAGLAVDQRE
jgi:adenylate cyclase